jgi:hypothetical protein
MERREAQHLYSALGSAGTLGEGARPAALHCGDF